jgi:hypothetical protein
VRKPFLVCWNPPRPVHKIWVREIFSLFYIIITQRMKETIYIRNWILIAVLRNWEQFQICSVFCVSAVTRVPCWQWFLSWGETTASKRTTFYRACAKITWWEVFQPFLSHIRIWSIRGYDPKNVFQPFLQCRINHMAEAAYATGPALLGAPRFWGPRAFGGPALLSSIFSWIFCSLFQRGAQTVHQCGAPKSPSRPENSRLPKIGPKRFLFVPCFSVSARGPKEPKVPKI